MTNAAKDLSRVLRERKEKDLEESTILDPLSPENESNLQAKEEWPFKKEYKFVSRKTEEQRKKAASRARKHYEKTRKAQGKPYIPMELRMKGRDACEAMGYKEWTSKQDARYLNNQALDALKSKLDRLISQRDGVERSIQDIQNFIHEASQQEKGLLNINYTTFLGILNIEHKTHIKNQTSLNHIHQFFQQG